MSANYKKLGDYIQPVDVRNSDLKVSHLLGVSVEKCFIESIANTIGTDFSKYKIVRKGQFTYIPDTSRRGDKIGIALLTDFDEGLVSNIYTVFEITDTSKLLPEYLMLWFSRPEFDRYARFKSHGSVREIFDWDEMCRVELPVPDLTEQQRVVNSYNTVDRRIRLLQQINEKLEKCITLNYKENCIHQSPLPEKWKFEELGNLDLDITDGNYSTRYPKYNEFVKEGIPFIRGTDFQGKYISNKKLLFITPKKHSELLSGHTKKNDILMSTRGEIGKIAFVPDSLINSNINFQLVRFNGYNKYPRVFLAYCLTSELTKKEIAATITGSVQAQLPMCKLKKLKILLPPDEVINTFAINNSPILNKILENENEISNLQDLKQIIISRISEIKKG